MKKEDESYDPNEKFGGEITSKKVSDKLLEMIRSGKLKLEKPERNE